MPPKPPSLLTSGPCSQISEAVLGLPRATLKEAWEARLPVEAISAILQNGRARPHPAHAGERRPLLARTPQPRLFRLLVFLSRSLQTTCDVRPGIMKFKLFLETTKAFEKGILGDLRFLSGTSFKNYPLGLRCSPGGLACAPALRCRGPRSLCVTAPASERKRLHGVFQGHCNSVPPTGPVS